MNVHSVVTLTFHVLNCFWKLNNVAIKMFKANLNIELPLFVFKQPYQGNARKTFLQIICYEKSWHLNINLIFKELLQFKHVAIHFNTECVITVCARKVVFISFNVRNILTIKLITILIYLSLSYLQNDLKITLRIGLLIK
jgi:hypothetical protein